MPVKNTPAPRTDVVRVETARINAVVAACEQMVYQAVRNDDGTVTLPRGVADAAWDALMAFRREGDDSRCPDCGKVAG